MFLYKRWDDFTKKLSQNGINSVTAQSVVSDKPENFLVLKHDVETNPKKALDIARIESANGHRGVYYVQAYLLNSKKNIDILKEIQGLGHEVSYHHDVMDFAKGNLEKATKEFEKNKAMFEENGFHIRTVCQHGNPVIERNGYTSNRDFFRSEKISGSMPDIAEVMVNFRQKVGKDYKYISDAGYGFKVIFDPENNDVVDSSDKDIKLEKLDNVLDFVKKEKCAIISIHPHRWNKSALGTVTKNIVFKTVKAVAKLLLKIPFMNKLMGRFYFLAKKI